MEFPRAFLAGRTPDHNIWGIAQQPRHIFTGIKPVPQLDDIPQIRHTGMPVLQNRGWEGLYFREGDRIKTQWRPGNGCGLDAGEQ